MKSDILIFLKPLENGRDLEHGSGADVSPLFFWDWEKSAYVRPNPLPRGESRGEGGHSLTWFSVWGKVSWCSPSPQPSPPGRGRASGRYSKIRASSFRPPPHLGSIPSSFHCPRKGSRNPLHHQQSP